MSFINLNSSPNTLTLTSGKLKIQERNNGSVENGEDGNGKRK